MERTKNNSASFERNNSETPRISRGRSIEFQLQLQAAHQHQHNRIRYERGEGGGNAQVESREERVYNDGSSLPPETVSYTFPCISGQCFTHGVSLHRMANGRGSSSREARVQSALEIRDQTVNLTLIHRMGRKIFYLAAFPRRCSFRFEMLVSSEEEKFLFFFFFFCIDLILGTSGSLIISDYGRKIFNFR